MNQVTLIGRLCADPELRHTQSQKTVCSFRLAVERDYKKEGQSEADFINCIAWDKNAEFASKYLKKGSKIAVVGRLQSGSYKKDDGTMVYTTDVIVSHHEFCGGAGNGNASANETEAQEYQEIADDDAELPF